MFRFPFASRSLFALVLLLPAAVAAQAAPAAGTGAAPAGSAALPAPAAAPAPTAAPSPAAAAPSGPTIDRGSLLAPTPAPRPATPALSPAPVVSDRTTDASIGANPRDVYAEDWWVHSRPIFELHGYLRVRAELFHGFALGRVDPPGFALWPQPADNSYADLSGGQHQVNLCGDNHISACEDKTQAGANMRFRVNPELHISDNLRILSQFDVFDNMVLGSTPDSYSMHPYTGTGNQNNGYQTSGYNTFAPVGIFTTTEGPPTSGINSLSNSVAFKRAWAEYMTPVGQLRFGRMPSQWGLGILANSGDGIDQDYQTNSDRIMFVSGIKSIDLYFGGAWDFVSSGPTSSSPYDINGGQAYNTCNLCNVNEYMLFVAR